MHPSGNNSGILTAYQGPFRDTYSYCTLYSLSSSPQRHLLTQLIKHPSKILAANQAPLKDTCSSSSTPQRYLQLIKHPSKILAAHQAPLKDTCSSSCSHTSKPAKKHLCEKLCPTLFIIKFLRLHCFGPWMNCGLFFIYWAELCLFHTWLLRRVCQRLRSV